MALHPTGQDRSTGAEGIRDHVRHRNSQRLPSARGRRRRFGWPRLRAHPSMESARHRRRRQCRLLRYLLRHPGDGCGDAPGLPSRQCLARRCARSARPRRGAQRTALGRAYRPLGRPPRAADRARRDRHVAFCHGNPRRADENSRSRCRAAFGQPARCRPARRQRQRLQRPRHHGLVRRRRARLRHEHQADGGAAWRRARRARPAVASLGLRLRRRLRPAGGSLRALGLLCPALVARTADARRRACRRRHDQPGAAAQHRGLAHLGSHRPALLPGRWRCSPLPPSSCTTLPARAHG